MATRADDNPLKARLRAVWKNARSQATSLPPAAPAGGRSPSSLGKTAEPPTDDSAVFRAAVAGAVPLPPDNRVELVKAGPRRLPPRQKDEAADKPADSSRQASDDELPAHWRAASPPLRAPLPSDPEAAALHLAMVGVQPLPASNRAQLGAPLPPPRPKQFVADECAALRESLHGPIGLQDRLEGGDEPNYLRVGLPNTVLRDLRRNRWVIQDEIDLHGLNRDEARHRLAGFLADCLQHGRRCVRVIHGKGHGSPQKLSILRQLVRGWLAQRQEVLAYCQAKPQDGGEGALLVLLRSAKKQGTA